MNVDILGISELKWTGMGEFHSSTNLRAILYNLMARILYRNHNRDEIIGRLRNSIKTFFFILLRQPAFLKLSTGTKKSMFRFRTWNAEKTLEIISTTFFA